VGLLEFRHAPTGLAVVLDDDGRVAYAYLRGPEGEILGDVWLYNRGPAPEVADWSDPSQAPFPNPKTHARPLDRPLPRSPDDLCVQWTIEGQLLLADVHLHGALLARLSPGSAPGWNVLVTMDGPCAQPFPE
jgi:hypothetical protein